MNYIVDGTAYYNFSVANVEYSEFYVVADLDQSAGDASLTFDLYSGCSNEFTTISDTVEEDNSTTTRLWEYVDLSVVPSETDGLLDAKLVVPLIAGTVSTHQVVNFIVPIYTSKRDTLVSEYLVYTFILDATGDGQSFSTNVESSRLISLYDAASEFGITTPSSSTSSSTTASSASTSSASVTGSSTSSTSVTESSTSSASTTSAAGQTNTAANTATSGVQSSTQASTTGSGSGSTGNSGSTASGQSSAALPTTTSSSNGASNAGSSGSQQTDTVSNEQTTLMTVTNCGTKTCTVLATQASNTGSGETNESSSNANSAGSNKATATSNAASPANGQGSAATSNAASTTGNSNTESPASSSATTPITLATSRASATPMITTQSSYNNGAISNIKGSGSFLRNLLLMTISVMFFI